jgi:O-antigen/teichoic acid export membrane protein
MAAVNIAANYFLIQMYDVTGAALATGGAHVLLSLVSLAVVTRMLGRQPVKRSTLKVIAAGVFAILVVWGVANLLFAATPVWFLPAIVVLYGASYGAALIGLKSLDQDDLIIIDAIEAKFGIQSEKLDRLLRMASTEKR